MSGLDSISLDASGFLDMDDFSDGSDLPDDAVAGLHDALLADPVDEPSDDDWAVLVDDVVADAGEPADGGPFSVDDDASFAGVRDASDDPADDGSTFDDDPADDDGGAVDDTTADDDSGDDGSGFDVDADSEVAAGDLVGLDLLDDDGALGLGEDTTAELAFDAEPEATADISHDFEDYL